VVYEKLSKDQITSGYITIPDDVLASGVKLDTAADISPDPAEAFELTPFQLLRWFLGVQPVHGHTNAFSLFNFSRTINIDQALRVWGHPITPDYTRSAVVQPTDSPKMPVNFTDTPKP
jgi:hypothetical protein